jgi:hypothetical protein
MRVDYLLAWLLPLFAGAGLLRLFQSRWNTPGALAAALGAGWIGGVFIAANVARVLGREDTLRAFDAAWCWMAALAACAWLASAFVWMRMRAQHSIARVPVSATPARRVLWWLLLLVIVVRLLLIGDEASLRPVFPWDAWSAWALKPKSWMLLGRADTYVSMFDWLSDPSAPTRTAATWNYPELLAWVQVWFASAAGGWNEPMVNVAWCGALAAFALAAYGYWRGLGLSQLLSIGLVYVVVSLPLLDTHAALAGYADLWLGITLGLATLAWSRWLVTRERGQWLLAVAFAACLPLIKLEGAVWLFAFSVAVMLDLIAARWRWRVAGLVVAMFAIGLIVGGFSLPIPGLGWVHIEWGRVSIPSIPTFELAWHPVGDAMLASLFTLPNWHLLWYAAPLIVAWRWRMLVRDHASRMVGLMVAMQLGFLFVLFFFTSAAAWAEDFTSANRLILQIVPALFAFIALLLRDAPQASASR